MTFFLELFLTLSTVPTWILKLKFYMPDAHCHPTNSIAALKSETTLEKSHRYDILIILKCSSDNLQW